MECIVVFFTFTALIHISAKNLRSLPVKRRVENVISDVGNSVKVSNLLFMVFSAIAVEQSLPCSVLDQEDT